MLTQHTINPTTMNTHAKTGISQIKIYPVKIGFVLMIFYKISLIHIVHRLLQLNNKVYSIDFV